MAKSVARKTGRTVKGLTLGLAVALLSPLALPQVAPADEAKGAASGLADQAHALLKTYCYRCHGVEFEIPGFNVLDRDTMTAARGEGPDNKKKPYLTPGKPDDSFLWQRVGVKKTMPPEEEEAPTDAELAVLKRWIEAGAPFPSAPAGTRPFRAEADILKAIRTHQQSLPERDRSYPRYFTLTNIFNNPAVTDDEVRLYRAALSKVVNSLSWESDIVVPKAIDAEQTVFAVDLRDLGWDEKVWRQVLAAYPYGLKYDKVADSSMRELAREVYRISGSDLPYLRADWFVANASCPPLYHELLQLPKDARELEKKLGVDVKANFARNRLVRAGFATSGVSAQNRMVERHPASYGAYWKSYDFRPNNVRANLFRHPLGPDFPENPFRAGAFEHDGGEIIFNLPNGLQGYLLINGKDERIDEGPIEVVRDRLQTTGNPVIVNGLSCMACHKLGVISQFKDTVREGQALSGDPAEKVEQLYPPIDAMDKLLKKDESRFLKSLDEATGPFLKVGADEGKSIGDFPEPVGAVARLYIKDLNPEEAAIELGMADAQALQAAIRSNVRLRQLGIGALGHGAAVKRADWDSVDQLISPFQNAARELQIGTPFRSF